MKKIFKLLIIQLCIITLLTSKAYAFKLPFFGNKKDATEESIERESKEREKEEKKKQKETEKAEKERKKEEEKRQKEIAKNKDKDYLSVETSIFYKTNDEDNWNQNREFSKDETCYVRVNSKAIYNKWFGKSEDVEVIYRFSGFKNTEIIHTEGTVDIVSNSNGILEYKKIIATGKKRDAETNTVIFRYSPSDTDTIVLDVIYGDNIKSRYDAKSTIFFK